MKKLTMLCAFFIGIYTCGAQTVIDHFNVGPYVVDYNGKGDVKYRLKDNINLYDFFELKQDTTIIAPAAEIVPVKSAIQINVKFGADCYASEEIGLEGVWKQMIGKNVYFNGGLSFVMGYYNFGERYKSDVLEIGVPLQIEFGKLNHQRPSIYGSFGVMPTFFSTMSTMQRIKADWVDRNEKKSGMLVSPLLEFGGTVPVGGILMRIGVFGSYKICATGDCDIYKKEPGRCFIGAKIGIIL